MQCMAKCCACKFSNKRLSICFYFDSTRKRERVENKEAGKQAHPECFLIETCYNSKKFDGSNYPLSISVCLFTVDVWIVFTSYWTVSFVLFAVDVRLRLMYILYIISYIHVSILVSQDLEAPVRLEKFRLWKAWDIGAFHARPETLVHQFLLTHETLRPNITTTIKSNTSIHQYITRQSIDTELHEMAWTVPKQSKLRNGCLWPHMKIQEVIVKAATPVISFVVPNVAPFALPPKKSCCPGRQPESTRPRTIITSRNGLRNFLNFSHHLLSPSVKAPKSIENCQPQGFALRFRSRVCTNTSEKTISTLARAA